MELLEACRNDNTELALELLEKEDYDINVIDGYGDTPLICVCRNKMVNVASKLLERGDLDYHYLDIEHIEWLETIRYNTHKDIDICI